MSNAIVFSFQVPPTVQAGQPVSAMLVMQNTGTETWQPATNLAVQSGVKLGSQNPQDNNRWGGTNRVLLPSAPVPPGQNVSIPIVLTAPMQIGLLAFDWKLLNEGVGWFGSTATATINVTAPPPINLSAVLSDRGDPSEADSGTLLVNGKTPGIFDSSRYVTDGQWRQLDYVNDTEDILSIIESYLWTGISVGGVVDTHVQLTAVDAEDVERLVNVIQWDHYAPPTTHQGRFHTNALPVKIRPGEKLRVKWYTQASSGVQAQHSANIWVVRG